MTRLPFQAYKPQEFRDTPADFEIDPIVLFRMTVIILLLLVLAFTFSEAEDNGKSGNNSCCFPTMSYYIYMLHFKEKNGEEW